jgi:WD40 repeat protein
MALFPLSGCGNAGSDLVSKLSGAKMSDVFVKVADLPQRYGNHVYADGLAFSPDGTHIAAEAGKQEIDIWDWRSGRVEKTIEQARGASGATSTNPFRYSPDGRFLAACMDVGRIWRTSDWSVVADFNEHNGGACNAMDFVPDGTLYIRSPNILIRSVNNFGPKIGPDVNSFIVSSVTDWQPVWGLRLMDFAAASLAVSPDGSIAAMGGTAFDYHTPGPMALSTRTIYFIDLQQRRVVRQTPGDADGPMAFSPDGARLAIVGRGYLEIIDVRSGERLLHERIEGSAHMNLRFTTDNQFLIESDSNGRGKGLGVRIWDSQHTNLLQHIAGNVAGIDTSRDGKYLAVGVLGRTTIWQRKQTQALSPNRC